MSQSAFANNLIVSRLSRIVGRLEYPRSNRGEWQVLTPTIRTAGYTASIRRSWGITNHANVFKNLLITASVCLWGVMESSILWAKVCSATSMARLWRVAVGGPMKSSRANYVPSWFGKRAIIGAV
ncbi:MAG: hypothetical protein ABI277_13930, partial [Burkholderiaceae bacterium]